MIPPHRTLALATALVLSAPVGAVLLTPPAAGATSCVAATATPAELLAGAPMFDGTTDRLLDSYDLVITGTVRSVGDVSDDEQGHVEVAFDVIGAFGTDEITADLTVSQADRGAMNGFPFEPGRTYFVPLKSPGRNGEPFWSFVCDPIREITRAEAGTLRDDAPAGVTTAVVAGDPPADPDPVGPGTARPTGGGVGGAPRSAAVTYALASGGLAAMGIAAAWLRRRTA